LMLAIGSSPLQRNARSIATKRYKSDNAGGKCEKTLATAAECSAILLYTAGLLAA